MKEDTGRLRLVDPPSPNTSDSQFAALRLFERLGCTLLVQQKLCDALIEPDSFGDAETGEFRDQFIDCLEALSQDISEHADTVPKRLFLLLGCLLGYGPRYISTVPRTQPQTINSNWSIPHWVSRYIEIAELAPNTFDWTELQEQYAPENLYKLITILGFPIEHLVDLSQLSPLSSDSPLSESFSNPKQIEFWFLYACKTQTINNLLQSLLPQFSLLPEEKRAIYTFGIINLLDHTFRRHELVRGAYQQTEDGSLSWKEDQSLRGWEVASSGLIHFHLILDEIISKHDAPPLSTLAAWWCISIRIYSKEYGNREGELSEDLKKRLMQTANIHLGKMRATLRETPEQCDFNLYRYAHAVLRRFVSPWQILKPLLLILAEMKRPSITNDLRYWPESNKEPLPHPYSNIATWIGSTLYSDILKEAIHQDPYLIQLREEWAKFFLERLKTKTSNSSPSVSSFVEPRVWWRRCYVNALTELRVNPGGKAHKTLYWLSQNDPDEQVRDLAKKAHKAVRHLQKGKSNIDPGTPPRRTLFAAFWWLRQAHLLALGVQVDEAGAQGTRAKELRRTRESEKI